MNSYRRLVLILGISWSLLSLISITAHTEARRVEAKGAAPVAERSGSPAPDVGRPENARLDRLFGRVASPAFIQAAWIGPFAALPQTGTTFTVNSTADPGTGVCDATECTLREAITAANALVGTDTIAFNIPSPGPYTITPVSPLPAITSPVVIDGYTQPGASANTLADDDNAVLMIELDGSLAGALNMLSISAGSSTVRGLVINRCSRAIAMDTNGGNIIEGNFLGTNVAGSAVSLNDYGVLVSFGSANNLIGGTTPAARNLISGNNFGVALLGGPGSMVQGNFIGTDRTGSNDLGNGIGVSVTASSNNTIGGALAGARNVISGNANGIRMQADNNVIQGNYIGVNATGGAFTGTGNTIGVVTFGTGTTIGGTTPAARNVISGHGIGISIGGPSTTVQGNFIGTDAAGTAGLGNTTAGINMQLSNNTLIGGTAAGAGNLISANGVGIQLSPSTTGITIQIQGNLIGTDVNGTTNLGNTNDGIAINDDAARTGTNITIGGTTPGARNVISGNNGDGIDLRSVTGVAVQGNLIGTQSDGTSPLGNSGHGINIVAAPGNTIGGTTPGAGNRIAFNGAGLNFGGGIIIEGSSANNNSIRGNSIFANTSNGTMTGGGLGIDLSLSGSGNGPTLNDACDVDTGPNNLQNFPLITASGHDGNNILIAGTLNSTANITFTLDFYSNPTCDPSGNGEGQTYIGSATVMTGGNCIADFTGANRITITPPAPVPTGQRITATATDPSGNTSEFSSCASPTAATGTIGGKTIDSDGTPISGATIYLKGTQSRETITDAKGNYGFLDVETNGFYTVTPARVNFTFSPPNRSFSLLGYHTEASFTATANGDHLNPLDITEYFVRQHYLDFLSREPDPPGFIGWVNTINNCAQGNTSCDRVHVSEMFFRSAEFQERGYFVYRFYSASLGRKPDYAEFTPDLSRVSGFLTNEQLEAAKVAFVNDFMSRPAFASQYGGLSNSAYVDALINTAQVNPSNRQTLIDSLSSGTQTRTQVLRQIAESGEVYRKYYNQAFVVMEYFGYLHRDPDALYLNWIQELDQTGDPRHMVSGFVNSQEYRQRFGSN